MKRLGFAIRIWRQFVLVLQILGGNPACSTHQIRDKMAQILSQAAPDFKINDIITDDKTQINNLIACLFVLFSDIS